MLKVPKFNFSVAISLWFLLPYSDQKCQTSPSDFRQSTSRRCPCHCGKGHSKSCRSRRSRAARRWNNKWNLAHMRDTPTEIAKGARSEKPRWSYPSRSKASKQASMSTNCSTCAALCGSIVDGHCCSVTRTTPNLFIRLERRKPPPLIHIHRHVSRYSLFLFYN